nr:reverse transcriptase domain-containing protein [Tanacetum cinerariifolium]
DQEKTTFTCPYGTFAYRRMPFGLCNAPGTFQRQEAFDILKACHEGLTRAIMVPISQRRRAYWALKHVNFDLKIADDHRKLQLNELNKLHDQAYENFVIYKERTKKLHDSKIKNHIFNVGDQVLLFNSRLKIFSGKLKTRWIYPSTMIEVSRVRFIVAVHMSFTSFVCK